MNAPPDYKPGRAVLQRRFSALRAEFETSFLSGLRQAKCRADVWLRHTPPRKTRRIRRGATAVRASN